MSDGFAVASEREPVRQVGLQMARGDNDLVLVVDDERSLVGVVSERVLARRYIRESRETSSLVDTPTTVSAVVDVLEGRALVGEDAEVAGRVWVVAMDVTKSTGIEAGDVAVVGDRPEAQRAAIELGAGLVVLSNNSEPPEEILELAREKGTALVVSPLDSYVTGRMITLAAPCSGVMDSEPLTVRPDDMLDDIADMVKDIHYHAAIAVDKKRRPVGLVSRSDLVNPKPRRVVLVDHAELSQSVVGVERAEIVEILDHHHIGRSRPRCPSARRSIPSARPRRSSSSASARAGWSRAPPRPRCCSAPSSRTP
jgi:manganese-dependent inorganic pyrophosphatase